MAEDRSKLTPEKQLLKLIEDPTAGAVKGSRAKGVKVSALSFGVLQGRFGFFRQATGNMVKGWSSGTSGPLDIRKINALLSVLTVATGAYFISSSFLVATRFSKLPAFSFKTEAGDKAGVGKYTSRLKALAFYKEKVATRDIFQLGARKAPEAVVTAKEVAAKQMEEVLGKFKLVGISWSDNPDAMIESANDQKTYFLKRGQVLDGVKVEAIYKDKVVLSYNGMEAELR
jgi:hypothetical protein